MDESKATAHLAWERRWASEEGRAGWLVPEDAVDRVAADLYASGARRALDLGCGVGRHALHLARLGFETCALDGAPTGIDEMMRRGGHELGIDGRVGAMTSLPWEAGAFDYVLAWNVIYHGDASVVRAAIGEIRRVLRPGGVCQGTMLSKRNAGFGEGDEVAPDTFVRPGVSDKDHPHFYCSAGELVDLFERFELLSLYDAEHEAPGSWHWHMVAERLSQGTL